VMTRASSFPLYSNDTTATTLSVVAHIDQRRYPGPLVLWPPKEWKDGWLLAREPDPALGRLAHQYTLGRNPLYLLCRGAACNPQ
jgi:hypothetical protein